MYKKVFVSSCPQEAFCLIVLLNLFLCFKLRDVFNLSWTKDLQHVSLTLTVSAWVPALKH